MAEHRQPLWIVRTVVALSWRQGQRAEGARPLTLGGTAPQPGPSHLQTLDMRTRAGYFYSMRHRGGGRARALDPRGWCVSRDRVPAWLPADKAHRGSDRKTDRGTDGDRPSLLVKAFRRRLIIYSFI